MNSNKQQKNQHTVPDKSHIKYFSDKDGFVWVWHKKKPEVFNTGSGSILKEAHFYTLDKDGKQDMRVENELSKVERAYIPIFDEKISKFKALSVEEREKTSDFFASLLLRTKPFRESLKRDFDGIKKMAEEFRNKFGEQGKTGQMFLLTPGGNIKYEDFIKYIENADENLSRSVISNLSHHADIIFNMEWSILLNNNNDFVTSDNPVNYFSPENFRNKKPFGLKTPDIEVVIPLSKHLTLLATHHGNENLCEIVDDKRVLCINDRVILSSSEWVVSSSETQGNVVMEHFNKELREKGLL